MKKTNKIIAVLLAVMMIFSCSVAAFAAPEYKETNVDSSRIPAAQAEKITNNIVSIAFKLTKTDAKALVDGLYTNEMAGTIIAALATALGNANGMLASAPKDLGDMLEEEQFAAAAKKLKARITDPETGKKRFLTWEDKIEWANGDWGFQDGDGEGFVNAVSTLLRAVPILTLAIKFPNGDSFDGYEGAYERLLPVFEMLELDGVISSEEYTKLFPNGMYPQTLEEFDNCLKPILTIAKKLLDKFSADPAGTVIEILPKLCWAIESGLLDECVHKITNNVAFVGSISIPTLDTAFFAKLIADAVSEIKIGEASISITEEKAASLIKDIAGCGKLVEKDSLTLASDKRMAVVTDKAKVNILIAQFVLGFVNDGTANKIVDGLELNLIAKILIKFALIVARIHSPNLIIKVLAYVLPIVNGLIK